MSRPKKYIVSLTDDEYEKIKKLIRNKTTSKTIRCRCQILIDLDEKYGKILTHEQSVKSNGVCMATVMNTVKTYACHGFESVTKLKRNVNSDNSRRIADGRVEAKLIEIACGPVPEGHSRWTLRLLEEKAKVELEVPIGKDAIGRA